MPKTHKPKWGYRSRLWVEDGEGPHFSDDAFNALCARYEIPEALKDRVRQHLEGSADVCHRYRVNQDEAPKPAERKAALEEIASLASALRDRLDQLDDFTAAAFWRSEVQTHEAAMLGAETTEFGHVISRHKASDDETVVSWETPDAVLRSLKIIKSYADVAIDRLPEDSGGAKRLEGVRMWTRNMFILWEDMLGRTFTLDYHAGEPLTEPARFCADALHLIDPDVPDTRIITAIRQVLKERRKRAPGRMPTQI